MLVNGKWKIVYRNAAFWSAKKTKQTIHHSLFTIHRKGFTLIELLVVIGILTILLAIVLVAINPQKQFRQANNTQRRSDVNAILNGVHQYGADNKGNIAPLNIPTGTAIPICKAGGTVTVAECPAPPASTDFCAAALLVPTYLADMPLDPTASEKDTSAQTCDAATGYRTGYTVVTNNANRITVTAPSAEDDDTGPGGGAPTISVTR